MMESTIEYKFSGLDLKQFATFEDDFQQCGQDINISCKFTFAYNLVQDIVCCSTSITMLMANGNPLIKADLDAYFSIAPSSVAKLNDDGCIVLSEGLQAQFASLSYGTMRGVIFCKTLNTPLNKIILPPNDVSSIFISPVKFK